jgi:hypothetical protein
MKSVLQQSRFILSLVLGLNLLSAVTSFTTTFTPANNAFTSNRHQQQQQILSSSNSRTTQKMMIDDTMINAIQSTSNTISTVSADIDSISNDQFGLVFAGGIAVMVGGVFSALMVGFLLESSNSYANVVADSYVQGGDEEFWESLSPEDAAKAKEMIAKLRASKEGKDLNEVKKDMGLVAEEVGGVSENNIGGQTQTSGPSKDGDVVEEKKGKEAVSMFSDYDD